MSTGTTARAPVPFVALLAAFVLLAAACADDEEQLPDDTLPSQTASPGNDTSAPTTTPAPSITPKTTAGTPTGTPVPVPSDWKSYTDAELGFSLRYPDDLTVKEASTDEPDSAWPGRRSVYLAGGDDPFGGFAIWVFRDLDGQPFEWWVHEFVCIDGTASAGRIDGEDAVFCSQVNLYGPPGHALVAEHEGRLLIISTGGSVTEEKFKAVVEGFQF